MRNKPYTAYKCPVCRKHHSYTRNNRGSKILHQARRLQGGVHQDEQPRLSSHIEESEMSYKVTKRENTADASRQM